MSVMRPSVVVCADHSIILVRSHQTRSDARSHEPAAAAADAASNLRGVKRRRQTRHPTRSFIHHWKMTDPTTAWLEIRQDGPKELCCYFSSPAAWFVIFSPTFAIVQIQFELNRLLQLSQIKICSS